MSCAAPLAKLWAEWKCARAEFETCSDADFEAFYERMRAAELAVSCSKPTYLTGAVGQAEYLRSEVGDEIRSAWGDGACIIDNFCDGLAAISE